MATNTNLKKTFTINNDNFEDLLSKLKDLSNISKTVKFKIDKENILIYSLVGETAILAFKNYTLKTSDYLIDSKETENDYNIDFVLYNAPSFIKKLNIMDNKKDIKMLMSLKEEKKEEDNTDLNKYTCRSIKITDGRLKASEIAGESHKIRDVNKDQLKQLLNIDNSKWSYTIKNNELKDIVKLSAIDSSVKIININVKKGKVIIKENLSWDLLLGDIEDVMDTEIIFGKMYLKSINSTEDIEFSIFDTFILFKDDNSNLMVSFEQTFEDEDYE